MFCTLTRYAISRAADGGTMSARSRRHVDGCERCAAFEAQLLEMGGQLRAASVAAKPAQERPRKNYALRGFGFAAGVGAAALIASQVAPGGSQSSEPKHNTVAVHQPTPPTAGDQPDYPEVDISQLKSDAKSGLSYVLKVTGLPKR